MAPQKTAAMNSSLRPERARPRYLVRWASVRRPLLFVSRSAAGNGSSLLVVMITSLRYGTLPGRVVAGTGGHSGAHQADRASLEAFERVAIDHRLVERHDRRDRHSALLDRYWHAEEIVDEEAGRGQAVGRLGGGGAHVAAHGRRHRNAARTAAAAVATVNARDGFAALAESLVDRGLATAAILDQPPSITPTERNRR